MPADAREDGLMMNNKLSSVPVVVEAFRHERCTALVTNASTKDLP
jgi:hypothetical protein